MFCGKCGAPNEDGAKFCVSCGGEMNAAEAAVAAEEAASAPQMHEETAAPDNAAEMNAAVAAEEAESVPQSQEAPEIPVIEETAKKLPVKKIIAALCAVIALAAVVFVGYNIVSGLFASDEVSFEDHPVIYVKEGDTMMLRNAGKKESITISDEYESHAYIQVTEDGKTMFFADDYEDNGEFKLYYRKTNQKTPKGDGADEKGIRLASSVQQYTISKDGKVVVFIKNGDLYVHNLKEDIKLEKDVDGFTLSDDAKKVIYGVEEDGERTVYVRGLKEKDEPQKVDSDVEDMTYYNDEFNEFYYTIEDKLYYKKLGKDRVKVADDIADTYWHEESDAIYITTEDVTELKFDDMFDDDCKESDEGIEYPNYSDFRTETVDEYGFTSYEYDEDAYDAAYEEYSKKSDRDYVRESYADEVVEISRYTLLKVDGTKTKKIAENLSDVSFYSQIITKKPVEEIEKIKLSEIEDSYGVYEKLEDIRYGEENGTKSIFTLDGKVIDLKEEDTEGMRDMTVSDDEKYLYCIEDYDEEKYLGTLKRYSITSKGISKAETVCEDVNDFSIYDDFVTIDGEDGAYYVYANGKKVTLYEEDGYELGIADGAIYFLDGYDEDDYCGVLKRYKDGKIVTLDSGEIYSGDYEVRSADMIYYIKDRSEKKGEGELWICDGTKTKLVDTDVSSILY